MAPSATTRPAALESSKDRSPAPRVIYVMGAGHSGSSILGVVLGNCASVFYAGEVEEWLVKSGAARWGGSERTDFWSRVRERMDGSATTPFGDLANRALERSSAIVRVDLWPAWRRLAPGYRRTAARLFRAIAQEAGASFVVDTSHFPLRARQLQAVGEIELHLVLLVRDPQAVIESNVRAISRHEVAERRARIVGANFALWLTHLLSLYVFLRQPRARRIFVRHEDFLADPAGVLRQILDRAGCDAAVPDLRALRVGVPIEGNRMLSNETIALQAPPAPMRRWSRLTALAQSPWLLAMARLRPTARAFADVERG